MWSFLNFSQSVFAPERLPWLLLGNLQQWRQPHLGKVNCFSLTFGVTKKSFKPDSAEKWLFVLSVVLYFSLWSIPDIATCSLASHECMFNYITECSSTFATLALSSLAPLFFFFKDSSFGETDLMGTGRLWLFSWHIATGQTLDLHIFFR